MDYPNFDTQQSSDDYIAYLRELAEVLSKLLAHFQHQNKQKDHPDNEQYEKKDIQTATESSNREIYNDLDHQQANQALIVDSSASTLLNGAESRLSITPSSIEINVVALTTANLAEVLGREHQGNLSYRADDYIINGVKENDGSISYTVRYKGFNEVRLSLDFTISANNEVVIHSSDLSSEETKKLIQIADVFAENPDFIKSDDYQKNHELLGEFAPYGTRAAVVSQKLLDEFNVQQYTPIFDIKDSSDPYTITKSKDGTIEIILNDAQYCILTANEFGIDASKFSEKSQSDFKKLYEQGTLLSNTVTIQDATASDRETAIQVQTTTEIQVEESRAEFVNEMISGDELCEWINALEATGASNAEMQEVLAVASEARCKYPDEFTLNTKKVSSKDQNNIGKSAQRSTESKINTNSKKIGIRIPPQLVENRESAMNTYRELQTTYGANGIISIIRAQKNNPVKITNPGAQINFNNNGKVVIQKSGASAGRANKNQTSTTPNKPLSKGFER